MLGRSVWLSIFGKRCAVLGVGLGDDGGDQDAPGVHEHVPPLSVAESASSTFLAPSNPRGPATRDALTDEESTTTAVGRLCRPDRVRTSPRTAVSTFAQMPARHHRRKCLCAADQETVKSWGRCRQAQPVRST